MIAEKSASSSSYDVRISAAMDGSWERISRHTSMPEPSGSRPSRMATSGRRAGIRRAASWASAGLTDDLDVALALQQLFEATPDDLVVVEEEDPDPGPRSALPTFEHGSTLGP